MGYWVDIALLRECVQLFRGWSPGSGRSARRTSLQQSCASYRFGIEIYACRCSSRMKSWTVQVLVKVELLSESCLLVQADEVHLDKNESHLEDGSNNGKQISTVGRLVHVQLEVHPDLNARIDHTADPKHWKIMKNSLNFHFRAVTVILVSHKRLRVLGRSFHNRPWVWEFQQCKSPPILRPHYNEPRNAFSPTCCQPPSWPSRASDRRRWRIERWGSTRTGRHKKAKRNN